MSALTADVAALPAVGDSWTYDGVAGKIIHVQPLYESGELSGEYRLTIKLSRGVRCIIENGRYRREGLSKIVSARVRVSA